MISDTDREATRVQVELLRRMTVEQRFPFGCRVDECADRGIPSDDRGQESDARIGKR